jgi:hypothetical protein
MVPFNLQLELNGRQVIISAEQLDQLADEVGFMRYQVKAADRTSVIYVNIEDERRIPLTAQDAEDYFETLQYAEQGIGYSLDDIFTVDEAIAIAKAIREYNFSRKLNFDQMNFDF